MASAIDLNRALLGIAVRAACAAPPSGQSGPGKILCDPAACATAPTAPSSTVAPHEHSLLPHQMVTGQRIRLPALTATASRVYPKCFASAAGAAQRDADAAATSGPSPLMNAEEEAALYASLCAAKRAKEQLEDDYTDEEGSDDEGEEDDARASVASINSTDDALEALLDATFPGRGTEGVVYDAAEVYKRLVVIDEAGASAILSAPQKSREWLLARWMRFTGSKLAAAVGCDEYETTEEFLCNKLWNSVKKNAAMEWGNQNEPRARERTLAWLADGAAAVGETLEPHEFGLMVSPALPWLGVSPDGIAVRTKASSAAPADAANGDKATTHVDLIEYKCPFYLARSDGYPYGAKPGGVPPAYRAQVQGIAGLLNEVKWVAPGSSGGHIPIDRIWFVVWQPHQTWVTALAYDTAYYASMRARLEEVYFKCWLPAVTLRVNRRLPRGELSEPLVRLTVPSSAGGGAFNDDDASSITEEDEEEGEEEDEEYEYEGGDGDDEAVGHDKGKAAFSASDMEITDPED